MNHSRLEGKVCWLCSLIVTAPLSLDVVLLCRLTVLLQLGSLGPSLVGGGRGGVGRLAGAGGGDVGVGGMGVTTGLLGTWSVLVVCF